MGEKLTREQVEESVREAREKGERANLRGVDLSEVDLREVNLRETNLSEAILSEAYLGGADLSRTNLSRANLSRAYLNGANLSRADLKGANLFGTYLTGTHLSRPDLREADVERASFHDSHIEYTTQIGRKWREVCRIVNPGARGGKLDQADFSRPDPGDVYVCWPTLSGADLSGACLTWADLSEANLSEANLSEADLTWANLSRVNLSEAVFSKARIGHTTFADVNLSTVKGLDTIKHQGPSYIDIHTLYRSQGKIPEAFLRGIGAPDTFITYAASLTGQAIQYYSCFISYSSQDDDFARRLYNDLQAAGVRCWFAPKDMKIGDKVRLRIDESIRIHDKLLVILSDNSVNSAWVEKEVETAFEEENRRGKAVLFPVRLDEAVMNTQQPWAADIRRIRHIGDFRRWKEHDAYQRAFEHLLQDLKAEETPIVPERFTAAAQPAPSGGVDSLRRQLARHTANRDKLREEIAVFAVGERPLHLRNQIEDEEREIARLEAELAELDRADQPDGNS